ncbi:MFS transporter [Streptomyces sp. NPDC020965]|uniref:MFS transporter n=1 Tax=Streptomyces sp. NPDC020965 TaxID=3365105 RepID=UPI00379B436A
MSVYLTHSGVPVTQRGEGLIRMSASSRSSYRVVLSAPSAWPLLATAGLARLSMGMLGLALVLSVHDATGSFGTAGLTLGAFALTAGVFAPVRGRLVDRVGRGSGIRLLGGSFCLVGSILLLLIATVREPAPLILVAAALGASAPPISAAARTAWTDVVGRGPRLSTALSLDTVTDELLSLAGPVLAGLLAATTMPIVALAAAIGTQVIAVHSFTRVAPATQGTRSAAPARVRALPWHVFSVQLRLPPVLIPLFAAGIGFGIIDVAVPALALGHGGAASAGWMLALLPAGSALGGLVYGRRVWSSPPIIQYRWLCLALAVGFAPLPLIAAWVPLWPLLLIAGLAIAPIMVNGYLLVDRASPDGGKTEAAAWVSTANNSGVAFGSALSGLLVTRIPLTAVFMLPTVAVLAGLTATFLMHRAAPADGAIKPS